MNTCSGCKNWTELTDDFDIKYHGSNMGKCASEKFVYTSEYTKHSDTCLVYWDGEGYSAGFETGGNFGCIHWEQKGDGYTVVPAVSVLMDRQS